MNKAAEVFTMGALLAYSSAFAAPYAVPKLVVLALGAVMIACVAAYSGRVGYGPLTVPALLFIGACLLSAEFSDDRWLAFAGRHNSYALGLVGLSLAMIYHAASPGGVDLEKVSVCGAFIGVHALAQWCGIDDGYSARLDGTRAIGTIGSPVDLGIVLAMIFPVALSRSLVYGIAVGLGILATGSRGAVLAGTCGLVAWRFRP